MTSSALKQQSGRGSIGKSALQGLPILDVLALSPAQLKATAEIFVTAFKALKSSERAAVWEKLVADTKLAEDLADSLALEARRRQPREPFRDVLKEFKIRV